MFRVTALAIGLLIMAIATGTISPDVKNDDTSASGQDLMSELGVETLSRIHAGADANSDGKMSLPEVLDFANRMRHGIAQKEIKEIVEAMDSDKNGKVSLEEFRGSLHHPEGDSKDAAEYDTGLEELTFKAADSDKDGELDERELPGFFYPETNHAVLDLIVADVLKRRDADGDGVLSVHEFWEITDDEVSDVNLRDFEKFDTDGSGSLSLAEIAEWESGRFGMRETMETLFKVADKDGDKHISAGELHDATASGDLVDTDVHYHLQQWAEVAADGQVEL